MRFTCTIPAYGSWYEKSPAGGSSQRNPPSASTRHPDNLEAGDDALHEAEDYALRNQMTSYRLNFVKTGDPNGGMLHSWPPFTDAPDQVMEFDRGSRLAPRPHPEQVDFWMRCTGPGA